MILVLGSRGDGASVAVVRPTMWRPRDIKSPSSPRKRGPILILVLGSVGEGAGIARKHTYDAAGQLLERRCYFEPGTTKEVWVAPVDRPPEDRRQSEVPATA